MRLGWEFQLLHRKNIKTVCVWRAQRKIKSAKLTFLFVALNINELLMI